MRKTLLSLFSLFLLAFGTLQATPSSEGWTNANTDVQDLGSLHLYFHEYFTVSQSQKHSDFFAPDYGCTLGVFEYSKWKGEIGLDYNGGTDDPLFLDEKIGTEEGTFFKDSPSFALGLYNVSINRRRSMDEDVVYAVIGKEFSKWNLRTFVGGYHIFRQFGKVRNGVMCAIDYSFWDVTNCEGETYKRFVLIADYQSGKNTLGGGTIVLTYYLTKTICLVTGPTWFVDTVANGRWKWTAQLMITLPHLFGK